ncbi:MAG: hypothetical protein JO095_17285, partial [Alphaproteobacteria bacterium]|nr:hypothetical protein [Alphaproteobacteria bacterium]
MTMPLVFAGALAIWFASATTILVAELGLPQRVAKLRLLDRSCAVSWDLLHTRLRANLPHRTRQPAIVRQRAIGPQITRGLLQVAAFAFGLGVTLPTLAQTISGSSIDISGQSTLQGDVVVCSGRPWIDVRCNGAAADGIHDDTNAINSTIATAVANNWPMRLSAGIYKVTSQLTIDYATRAGKGFRLVSDGAVIDGRTIASGPVLQIRCGGGTMS